MHFGPIFNKNVEKVLVVNYNWFSEEEMKKRKEISITPENWIQI